MPENRDGKKQRRKAGTGPQPQKRNETSWKEGQSGNPGGRPKGLSQFRELVRERLTMKALAAIERHLGDEKNKLMGPDVIRAAVEAWSFGWGKPSQPVEVSGAGGSPIALGLRRLSDEDLDALERIADAAGVGADAGDGEGGEGA